MERVRTRPWLSRRERFIVGLELLLSVGALYGAIGLMSGWIDLRETARDLPFSSPFFGGVALALFIGIFPAVVAALALLRPRSVDRWIGLAHVTVGLVLMGWIAVQVGFIGLGAWLQVAYFGYGLLIVVLSLTLRRTAATLPRGPEGE